MKIEKTEYMAVLFPILQSLLASGKYNKCNFVEQNQYWNQDPILDACCLTDEYFKRNDVYSFED